MNRRLIVMRHAKSAWNTNAPTDHQRPLNKRGRRDAPRIAKHLVQLGWVPDHVISSDSTRTRETYDLMTPAFPDELSVDFERALYHAGPSELAELLCLVPDEIACVLALGHNPGWEEVVEWLSEESIAMTTANAALLEVEADTWRAAMGKADTWRLHEVLRPKELT